MYGDDAEGVAPEAGAPEIEVTPEMVAAGVSVLAGYDGLMDGDWVGKIYAAMERARSTGRVDDRDTSQ